MLQHKGEMPAGGHSRLVRKVSVVLCLLDDLTDQPIATGQVHVTVSGRAKPVYKEGGWVCLLDLPDGEHHIHLEGHRYQPKDICLCTQRKEDTVVLTVRMMPNAIYPLPPDAISLSGQVSPGQTVRLIMEQEGSTFKLLQDYQGGRVVHIFSAANIGMDGRTLCFDNAQPFLIHMTVDEVQHTYVMDRELTGIYRKGRTMIGVVNETTADETGKFFFPIRLLHRGYTRKMPKLQAQVQVLEGGWAVQKLELQVGERRTLEMVKEEGI